MDNVPEEPAQVLRWRLAPGVVRLRERRLAGGAPFRVMRLGEQAEAELASLLGSVTLPAAGSRIEAVTASLVRYGLLLGPAPVLPGLGADDVTVVIPALSAAAAIQALLPPIPGQVPVIVVDDGSQPALEPELPGRPALRVVRHERPRGPAAARNAGARLACTPWVAFVDADVVPPDGWLPALLARATDPATVAIAPRIVSSPGRGAAGFLETWAGALDLGPVPADVAPGLPVSYVPSAALLVRRESFAAVGGFDESLRIGEDVDLIWRLSRAGRIRYEPDIICRHHPRSSMAAVIRRRYQYGTSAAALAQRHPGSLRHVEVSIWSFVPWAISVLVHPAAGGVAAAAAVVIAPRGLRELPAADARRLAARGHRQAFEALGRWLVRPMWPLTAAAAVALPGRRMGLLAAVAVGAASHAWRSRPVDQVPSSPAGRVSRALPATAKVLLAAVVDDISYSTGVWAGCVRERTWGPLLPGVRVGRRKPAS